MRRSKKTQIAEMLLAHGLITNEQLEKAMEIQKKTGKKIGQVLVDLKYISEEKLLELLSQQLHVPYVDLKSYPLDPEVVKLLPEFQARHFRAIVLKCDANSCLVGMVDPQDLIAHEEIEKILKRTVDIALIREEDLLSILDNIFRRSEEITHFAETLSAELKPIESAIFLENQDRTAEDMPVVNLLRSIFEDAVQINASDIHIEPGEKVLRIRLRVDGVLQEQIIEEKDITQALVQRIKIITGLNIAETRLPQDGRFTINVKNKMIDVRVSTIPVQYGESLVMRLLNQSDHILELEQIGMPKDVYDYFAKILFASYGLFLIVGPTGSGKTTTLYAALNKLNSPDKKIITVEDPVEYRLPRINQVQVNSKINLTFANVLRSILRQDPDIIMVGELRDQETVEIAIRAAMTGHFVLATLHTNDTVSSAARLLDMGAQGYLVASVLRGVLAQRLVRKICKNCISNDPLNAKERAWIEAIDPDKYKNVTFKKGQGCTYCHRTGYLGRAGVFELLPITDELVNAIRHEDVGAIQELANRQPVYRSLLNTALDMAVNGITTVDEVISMAGQI